MKKGHICIIFAAILTLVFTGCGQAYKQLPNSSSVAVASKSDMGSSSSTVKSTKEEKKMEKKRVASDGADMQKDNPTMPTRKIPKNGTRIKMHFGDTVIPGVLNDSETAQALINKLPVTVQMNHYSHDFCGSASSLNLPYKENEVHYGWLNGDIDYAIDQPWFTILFEDEKISEQYGYQVNIGVIDAPLKTISSLKNNYDVLIELAK